MQFVIHNWYLFVGIVVVLVILAWGPLQQLVYGIRQVSIAEAVRLINQEHGVVVDVREAEEYQSGHIPKAVHAPLSALGATLSALEKYKSRPVIVCCRTSQRSARAAVLLRKREFANVRVLAGGIVAWQGDHLPVER
jgi:rhodanese-related sulfurtransferase